MILLLAAPAAAPAVGALGLPGDGFPLARARDLGAQRRWPSSSSAGLPSTDNLELQRFFHRHAAEPVRWVALADPRSFHGAPVPFLWPRPMPPVEVVVDAAGLTAALAGGTGPVIVTAKHPLPPGAEALLAQRGSRIFSSLPPWLARVNLFRWLDRADMTYAWRVDRPAAPRPQGLTVQPGNAAQRSGAKSGGPDVGRIVDPGVPRP